MFIKITSTNKFNIKLYICNYLNLVIEYGSTE